jgi:beta-glucosidase
MLPDWEALPLVQQVAQLFVVRACGSWFDSQRRYPQWEADRATLEHWIADRGVGGVILLGGSAAEVALRTRQMQTWADIPLLIAADIEEGVGQRFEGATWFPPPMALGAIAQRSSMTGPNALPPGLAQDLAEQMGAVTAEEALALGLNWILAPTTDINNNPANPVINVRAFGDTPTVVGDLATAFLSGAQRFPVLTTAKHFPGHGDTANDSHLELPVIPHDLARLQAMELPPFQRAIAQGVDAVMTAHLQIPSLDPQLPATLSPWVLEGLLRRDLGFNGLIVTDALIMGAIAQNYGPADAALLAFEAGADVLLMPADLEGAIAAIVQAIETGRVPYARLQASLTRLWRAKQKVCGLSDHSGHVWETAPEAPLDLSPVGTPAAQAVVIEILGTSQEHQGGVLPVVEAGTNLILTDSLLQSPFLGPNVPAIAQPQSLGYAPLWLDSSTPEIQLPLGPVLLQLFIRGNPFRGSAGLGEKGERLLQRLLAQGQLQGLVLYGSPYLWQHLRAQLPHALPAIFSYGQMPAAQAIALDRLCAVEPAAVYNPEFTT